MKIVTWNINSVRLRLLLLHKLILEYKPDVICLQETKVIDSLFPYQAIRDMGYEVYYTGSKAYNGVAILTLMTADNNFCLRFYNDDKRHIAIGIEEIEIHNFYVPAGGDAPDVELNLKFRHKLSYLEQMYNWFKTYRFSHGNMILVGDLNIAPYEHDVWSSKALRNEVSHTDIERSTLLHMCDSLNFIDSARHFIDMEQKYYSWWSYRNIDWQKSNRGRRLDHIWVSNDLKDKMDNIQMITEARSWPRPSDHVPYLLEINV